MKNVSKKKVSKKRGKKRSEAAGQSAAPNTEVVFDEEEEEEASKAADEGSEEEEEGEEEDERKRQRLLEAISALGGGRKRSLGERSEAAVHMSEFTVSTEGEGHKIRLSELIGGAESTPEVPARTQKQLKSLQTNTKTIESPLSKQETDRIRRDVAFQKAATEVSRWTSIISQNQRAEQLVFPLHQEPSGPRPIEKVVTGWKACTPLEQEVFALLTANKQPILDPVLTPAEEASVRAMSLEEAKIRRAELQKVRALQSYYEAKARRDRKIKSKKYHRVQNKAKRKDFVKRFDDMVKTDPAAALEELKKMELARMQERMSLKHQNSSKWAKSKALMAKYDEGARKAMQEQLEVNKDLTQKLKVTPLNQEEEEEDEEEVVEVLPDFVNDAEGRGEALNPWMRGKLSEDPAEKEASEGLTAQKTKNTAEEEEEEEEAEETEEEVLLREFESRRKLRRDQEEDTAAVEQQEEEEEVVVVVKDDGASHVSDKEEEQEVKDDKALDVSDEEEEEDEEVLSEFTNIFRGIVEGCREADTGLTDASAQLEEGLTRIRTLEDVELLPQEEEPAANPAPADAPENPTATQKAGKSRKRKKVIELKEVLTKQTKVIKVPLAPTVEDSEDGTEEVKLDQRRLIKEAFAGDDVISDFLKDKRRQEDVGKPKKVDLTLPGWGEWGGTGVTPQRRGKRRRFRAKLVVAPPPPPRKDQCLPNVIISEKRNASLSLHQVSSLPFPFETHAQFESTVRSPVGRTWNTERTVKKITKPRVVTQLGAIIQPMAEEELSKNQKRASAEGSSSRRRRRK